MWRSARPIDVCLAIHGGGTLSQQKIEEFKRKFGKQIEKYRPWGMVIGESSSIKARLYSRSASAEPDELKRLSHEMHDSFDCRIDQDGVVELRKYVDMPRSFWDSKQVHKKSFNGAVFTLLCPCSSASCKLIDGKFLRKLVNIQAGSR